MKHFSFFNWIFLILLCGPARAQKFQYTTYEGQGVPFSHVNQVLQDHLNFLWIASEQGLYRFNGTHFEDFNTSVKSRDIRSLLALNDSTILFSNDTGIHRLGYDGRGNIEIDSYLDFEEDGVNTVYPGHLFLDSRNRLWIAGLNGTVYHYQEGQASPEAYSLSNGRKTQKTYFAEDSFNTVWVLIPSEGLFYLDEPSKKFMEVQVPFKVNHFLVEEDRMLLAGEDLEQWTLSSGHQAASKRSPVTDMPHIQYLTRDQAGLLFLATDEGLFSLPDFGQKDLQAVYGSNDPHRVEDLPFREVNQLYFTKDHRGAGGTLWVSTPEGLSLLFSSFFQSVSGMSHDNVFAIGKGLEGRVHISQGKVYRIDPGGVQPQFSELRGSSRITSIGSSGNSLWMGSADGQLYAQNPDGTRQTKDLSNRGGGIFYMYGDAAGELWFCQAPAEKPIMGIAKVSKEGVIRYYGQEDGLRSRILVAAEGGKNELYIAGIGTETYLYKYDRAADTFINHSQAFTFSVSSNFEVHDLAVDEQGMVWMGTTDGLLKYDTEKIYRIELGRHTEQEIRAVCTMPDGSVWLATDTSGLIHLNNSGNYVLFDEKSGTPSKIASYRGLLLDGENRLWVGTAEGPVYSSLTNPVPLQSSTPRLKEVWVNNRIREKATNMEFARDAQVEISMVAVAYPARDIRYRYKYFPAGLPREEIEDVAWIERGQELRISLKGLAGGNYQLWSSAQQAGGHKWSEPAIISFRILKPWFAQWWGMALLTLAGLLGFWYGIKLWTTKKVSALENNLVHKQEELNAREAELKSQTDTINQQKEALKSAGVTVYLLRRLIRQLPREAEWGTLLPFLDKLVELPTGLDAFEIALLENGKLKLSTYVRGGGGELYQKELLLDEKANMQSYALCNRKELLLKDYENEATEYLPEADDRGFGSRIYIPFELRSGQEGVFCAYAKGGNALERRDMTMLQILAAFLERSVKPG